ncbi:uroporphyrin-III C-methyltransferase [Aquisalimonas asiatica]|uniref:uroporphyrinogen-III C-methyltransferase n=1 Tax=Aquisalimonas asiatica TaxID=406100 RepID=A0A1H8QCC6_9GAMM|nr:uroporphyrin-III C-methyltransferase [Aquisalimonas asiatica]
MTDTLTLTMRTGGRPVLVLGAAPEAERWLDALALSTTLFRGWGAAATVPGVAPAARPDSEAALHGMVANSAMVVILDEHASDAAAVLNAAAVANVPTWVPGRPAAGTAEPALPAGGAPGSPAASATAPAETTLPTQEIPATGFVSLVGAGPGAPDLLTLRGLRTLQKADVVIHDRLVAASLLEQVPAAAERIFVGKRRSNHAVPQEQINQLLLDRAREGKHVVRLKGGDPFIFGRGGEEIEHLMEAGVPFRVVPGVTAASGCAAYAGIPLTHRDYAQSCVFATGHRREGALDLDFQGLVRAGRTLVFYMGLHSLQDLCDGLIGHGMRADMPTALVQQGTTVAQRVITAPLNGLPEAVAQSGIRAPTLLIIGEVVALRDRLAWFEGTGESMAWAENPDR